LFSLRYYISFNFFNVIFISGLKLYQEDAALSHIKSLSFTRNAMIPKEQIKTNNYIRKQLEAANINVISEAFRWTKSLSILMKLAFLMVLIFGIIYEILVLMADLIWIILILDVLLAGILAIMLKNLFDMTKFIDLGKEFESENLLVKIPARNLKEKRPVIFFSAHSDSISVKYSYNLIKSIYISGALLIISYLILTFILSIWSILAELTLSILYEPFFIIQIIAFLIGLPIILEFLILLLNKRTNESVGAIDNASGVAILIELVKLFNKNPLNNIDLIFLWCSAEEWGLMGSRHFLKDHFENFNQTYELDNSYNINIDMVGTYLGLVYKTGIIKKKPLNENLNDIFIAQANQQNIVLKKAEIPIGAASDHISFKSFSKKADKKLQAACFCSTNDTKYIHSPKDIPELCFSKNLNGCIDICYHTVRSLDLRSSESEEIR